MLSAQAGWVKAAVMQILIEGGYALDQKDDATGRPVIRESSGPWDWLLRRRLDTGLSHMEAMVTPAPERAADFD